MWTVLFALVSLTMHGGLPNIGNSCYINSAIQVMYHTDVIRTGVLAPDIAQYLAIETETTNELLNTLDVVYSDAIACELLRKRILVLSLVASIRELFRAMDANAHASSLTTILQDVRSSILLLLGQGAVDDAGDSSEVLLTVLNCFSEIAPLESVFNSLVSTLVSPYGVLRIPVLLLDVFSEDETTLDDLIAAYVDNTSDRDYAGILYMAINRQQYVDNTYTKLCTPIRYPAILYIDKNTYHLHSIIVHDGDSRGGHYYAVIKDLETGRWTVYNDSLTTAVAESQVLDNYCLCVTHVSYVRQRDLDTPTGRANSLYGHDLVRILRMYLLYRLLVVCMIYYL